MHAVTHDGTCHLDDLFAGALLQLLHPAVTIIRSRDPAVLAAAHLRFDVGGRFDPSTGDYDHHQPKGAGQRPNGVPYAAAGLLWRTFGPTIVGPLLGAAGQPNDDAHVAAVVARVDQQLIQPIDAGDNGMELSSGSTIPGLTPLTLATLLDWAHPTWREASTPAVTDQVYAAALPLARHVLTRAMQHASAELQAATTVRQAIAAAADPRIIVVPVGLPWQEVVVAAAPAALFVVVPNRDGSWRAQGVPTAPGAMAVRLRLPHAWNGLRDGDLAAITGVADARFCHRNGWLAVAGSRAGALALVARALVDGEVWQPPMTYADANDLLEHWHDLHASAYVWAACYKDEDWDRAATLFASETSELAQVQAAIRATERQMGLELLALAEREATLRGLLMRDGGDDLPLVREALAAYRMQQLTPALLATVPQQEGGGM